MYKMWQNWILGHMGQMFQIPVMSTVVIDLELLSKYKHLSATTLFMTSLTFFGELST